LFPARRKAREWFARAAGNALSLKRAVAQDNKYDIGRMRDCDEEVLAGKAGGSAEFVFKRLVNVFPA
jgi:hypothetical protein